VRERLPEYMVPVEYERVAEIPLTGNGKVDRRALPGPGQRRSARRRGSGMEAVELSSTEEIVSGIWGEVLGVSEVSRSDNFFDLGGHSLLATRLITRARECFGVDIPLRDIFNAPTVEGLSRLIEESLLMNVNPENIDELLSQLESIEDEEE
jgi:acyl carrier protein